MLALMTLEEVQACLEEHFPLAGDACHANIAAELVPVLDAMDRILAEDIHATEYVPSFNRSSVDGYAVMASDTFGCSDSIPAILNVQDHILMGEESHFILEPNACASIPTGGALPEGADAVQMIEYTEEYGDGTVGIAKPVAPSQHIIFKGDDVYPEKLVLRAGTCIGPKEIGALSALGISEVPVRPRLTVGIISTGDELVEIHETPNAAQVRCVNSRLLLAMMARFGVQGKSYGIIKDREELLQETVAKAVRECDVVLISGGSSVGVKDVTSKVIGDQGELLFHGIALKPGKPTILGKIAGQRVGKACDVPIFGLPGHPVAVFFVTLSVVYPLLERITGKKYTSASCHATLSESVSANHGRTQFVPVILRKNAEEHDSLQRAKGKGAIKSMIAEPIRNKSGLITTLADADGYFIIPQACEGYAKDSRILVHLF